MADKQISDLTAATGLTDGSLFVIEQSGAAKSANWGMVKNYISPGVAAQYSSSSTYNVGDYVIYNGQLYRCTTAITTPESWTAAHWTAVVLGNDIAGLWHSYKYYVGPLSEKTIPSANIDSSGNVISASDGNTIFCYNVSDTSTVTIDTDSGNYVYAWFTSEPSVGSQSHNSGRFYGSGNVTASVPSGCSWLGVRQITGLYTYSNAFDADAGDMRSRIKALEESQSVSVLSIDNNFITNSNWSTRLPDANNASLNKLYLFSGDNVGTSHLPTSNMYAGWLVTFEANSWKQQIVFANEMVYSRVGYDTNWNAWEPYYFGRQTVRVGADEQFTKLTDALDYAYARGNCDVYVNSGTYDIFSELGGSTYFNSFVFSDTLKGGGPVVGNDCNYYFSPGAIVTFVNTTSNSDVAATFSPFNAGDGNFLIDGLNVSATKCRYAFHDELTRGGVSNKRTVEHIFKNCSFYKDNSGNANFTSPLCIGGGLPAHGGCVVTIENCYFNGPVSGVSLADYHNGQGGTAPQSQSKVSVIGCFVDNGCTVSITSYGTNANKTVMFVSGCSLGINPINNTANGNNTILKSWGNVIA